MLGSKVRVTLGMQRTCCKLPTWRTELEYWSSFLKERLMLKVVPALRDSRTWISGAMKVRYCKLHADDYSKTLSWYMHALSNEYLSSDASQKRFSEILSLNS